MSLNPDKTAVHVVASDCILADRLLRPGTVAELPHALAQRWLQDKRARPAHLVRVRLDEIAFVGSATHEKGVELELEEDAAARLHRYGVGTILDPRQLTGDLPARLSPVPVARRLADLGRMIRATVTGKTGLFFGNRHFLRGETIELPEHRAIEALSNQAIQLLPGQTIALPPDPDQIVIPPAA
jgi:hypothetical protein